jgi:hypothetical protein
LFGLKLCYRFLFYLTITAHAFACIWVKLGNEDSGWIDTLNESHEYGSSYIAAFYWVITTFTTVGYGEIKGTTENELLFTILTEVRLYLFLFTKDCGNWSFFIFNGEYK